LFLFSKKSFWKMVTVYCMYYCSITVQYWFFGRIVHQNCPIYKSC
jgi:hypothetical protein